MLMNNYEQLSRDNKQFTNMNNNEANNIETNEQWPLIISPHHPLQI